MQIYVACLAAYNAGRLHGVWIDATPDADAMAAEIAAMLAASPVPDAEEYAVHDYDGFPDMGEYPSMDDIAETAALVDLAAGHGLDPDAFAAVAANWHGRADDIRDALGRFVGVFDRFRDYADDVAESYLSEMSGGAAEYVAQYFDYDWHAKDLAHGYTVLETSGGVAVFVDGVAA